MNNTFPDDIYLDIASFSRVLDKTTNSYKYLFLFSILAKIKDTGKSDLAFTEIKFIDLAVEMLLIAWFPHRYFKLSFGLQDQCAKVLNQFIDSQSGVFENGPITEATLGQLRQDLFHWLSENNAVLKKMLSYVPYRLLTPFFEDQLRGMKDAEKNKAIVHFCEARANDVASIVPLYQFTHDSILIDASWREYMQKNMPVIEGWVKWNWCEYLQNRNPSVPSIPHKVLPVLQRISMNKEIEYWKKVQEHKEIRCIYTGKALETFELDHFLPWTFVTHNQLWNLIPVDSSANASKSNHLPDLSYFEYFVEEQASAIQVSKTIFPEKQWEKYMAPYVSDLNIACVADVLDGSKLESAYEHTLLPLYEIAKTNGFGAAWVYQNPAEDTEQGGLVMLDNVDETEKFVSYLPFYPLEIAAGGFAESGIPDEPNHWVDVSELNRNVDNHYFISQVSGHSMEPLIPDGSFCLFKYGVVGSRNGKIVLVKRDGFEDPDTHTSFTIKRYFSKKIADPEFEWQHEIIELRPENPDYPVLTIESDDSNDFAVIAEFVQVL